MTKKTIINEAWDALSHPAKELFLHGENNPRLVHESKEPIMENLTKKFRKGVYDKGLAKKLWMYHSDNCARDYCNQFGARHDKWHEMFKKSHRAEAAGHWEERHRESLQEAIAEFGDTLNETELLEISKDKLKQYLDKASKDLRSGRSWNREAGKNQALKKLSKEEYMPIIEAALQKKPVEVKALVETKLKEKASEYVEVIKQHIRESMFRNEEAIEEDVELLDEAKKKKKKKKSNAIHATIHANDKTGQ